MTLHSHLFLLIFIDR